MRVGAAVAALLLTLVRCTHGVLSDRTWPAGRRAHVKSSAQSAEVEARLDELRAYAADQCTAPVPRVNDARFVLWTVARSESPFVEQWVSMRAAG
jgi:hypothetical protein